MPQVMTAPRDEMHSATDWKAGAWAGVIAGLVFMMLEMGMVRLFMGESPWAPPHMIAAMALGEEVLPAPGTWAPFDLKIMMTAMMIHFPLSIAYGLIGAWLVHRFDWIGGAMIGAGLGLALYIVNFYIVAPVAFPWFTMAQNWVSAFSHVMYGAVIGLCYMWLRKPRSGNSAG